MHGCGKSNSLVYNMYGNTFRSQNRTELRKAWNGTTDTGVNNVKRNLTPFRAVNNAGDLLSRRNYSCGGPNQVSNVRRRQSLAMFRGTLNSMCDTTDVPAASCNPRFVYDSSDYSKFKRQTAINKLYHDSSFGGSNRGHVSMLRHTRR